MKVIVSARRPGRLPALAAATVLALALSLTGCGAEEEDPGVASAGGAASGSSEGEIATSDNREQVLEFTTCLREHGMDIDDPAPGEGLQLRVGPDDQEAMDACRDLAPEGGTGGGANTEMAEAMSDFAECMRENGVEAFPDPDPENPGRMMITPEIGEDPDFAGAEEACADVLPDGGQAGGPA